MKNKNVILIIVIGIIAGGFSYWFNPYNEMRLFGVHIYIIMAVAAFLSSLILKLRLKENASKIAILITVGVIIGIMCRIVFDGVNDSNSHNLFPFEIIAALFMTVPSAFIGSYLAQFIKYIKAKIGVSIP